MGYSKKCPVCKGSGSIWGWTGFILLLPLHLIRIFIFTFQKLAWAILIGICIIFVNAVLKVNANLIDKYTSKNIGEMSDNYTIILMVISVLLIMICIKFITDYIKCPKCRGIGDAGSLYEPEVKKAKNTKKNVKKVESTK